MNTELSYACVHRQKMPNGRHLENLKWWYISNQSADRLRVWFYYRGYGNEGSNWTASSKTKSKMAAGRQLKIWNGDVSEVWPTARLTLMRVRFSGTAFQIELHPVIISTMANCRHLGIFKWQYLSGMCRPFDVEFNFITGFLERGRRAKWVTAR